jgi:transposase, IS5 family
MSYKQMDNNFSFTDLALFDSMEHNRSIARMDKINTIIINWSRIESLLLKHYSVGKSVEGAGAYPPLLLLKCFLLKKWFHIDSDPELETQINDRISFNKFLGLL